MRLDHALSPGIVAQRLTGSRHGDSQGPACNGPPIPDASEDLLLGDDTIPLPDEIRDQIEDPSLYPDR
jgi:hypothetical protein